MNKTAELVRLWAEYEEGHKNADVEGFCQFYLIKIREMKTNMDFLGGVLPPDLPSTMAKLIGRIAKIHLSFATVALKKCGINNFEDFMFLNSIFKMNGPRKTEVIYQNFIELSSGLLIIDRLKKNGLVTEEDDKEDKRSKRLKTTKKGKHLLEKCYKSMFELNKISFEEMPGEDIQLCIQLMTSVELKLSALWLQHKGKMLATDEKET